MTIRHFLATDEWPDGEILRLVDRALDLKGGSAPRPLAGRVLVGVFFDPSLRTRTSFEVAMFRHGGHMVVLEPGRGSWAIETREGVVMDGAAAEHLIEAAGVLGRYGDAVAVRAFPKAPTWQEAREDAVVRGFAAHAGVPVINLESARRHPCQGLADALTLRERFGPELRGRKFVLSWAFHPKPLPTAVPASAALAAARLGMEVVVARPEGFDLDPDDLESIRTVAARAGGSVQLSDDLDAAVSGADAVYAKSWGALSCFGDPASEAQLRSPHRNWRIDENRMKSTRDGDGIFLHCLPVRRNVVVTDEVLAGQWSAVVDQAENRLWAQQALLENLLGGGDIVNEHVAGLKEALDYTRLYRDQVFVIKLGGEVVASADALAEVAIQIALLESLSIRVVVVHGGGPQASELSRRLGIEPEIVAGRRVTSPEVLEVAKMVYGGRINVDILAALRAHGVSAVGLSGIDAGLVTTRRRPPVTVRDDDGRERLVDFGEVGDVVAVDPALIELLLPRGYVPVVASLAADSAGKPLNINADTLAEALARALGAKKLIYLTGAPGLLRDENDPSSLVAFAGPRELEALLSDGTVRGGMRPKVEACLRAVAGGVRRTHIIDGLAPDALLIEVFTGGGSGTMIVAEVERTEYEEEIQ